MNRMKIGFAMALVALLATGCKVKETEQPDGDTQYQVEPAAVEVGTDTQTVKVPDVDIVSPDSTASTN
jgi:hypothetical protein